MAGPINRHPEGMLDLFGAKQQGTYPSTVLDNVQPSVDLLRLYTDIAAVNANAVGANIVAATAAGSLAITSAQWLTIGNVDLAEGAAFTRVPQGELWLVLEAMVIWSMNDASHVAAFDLICRGNAAQNYTHIITDGIQHGFSTGVAAPLRTGSRCSSRPFIMLPGDELKVQHDGISWAAGAVGWNANVRVRRLTR